MTMMSSVVGKKSVKLLIMDDNRTRSEKEQHQLDEAMIDLFERRICFNEHLGLKVIDLWGNSVTTGFAMRPEFVGHYLYGRLHGGVISTMLDTTGGLAVMAAIAKKYSAESCMQVMQRFAYLGTIDMRVDYIRQGKGQSFVADSEVVRLGGRIATTRMNLSNEEGTVIATGNATYIVSGPNTSEQKPN